MFRTLLAAALAMLSLPAIADERTDGLSDVTIFACGTGEDASEGMLELRGGQTEDGGIQTIQFVETDGGVESQPWPVPGVEGHESMYVSNSHGPEGYLLVVRWSNGDLTYNLYSHVKPENADGISEGDAGLVVLDAGSKVARSVACTERPSVYLDVLFENSSCDEQSPLGVAGCDVYNPANRAEPLIALYPWLLGTP